MFKLKKIFSLCLVTILMLCSAVTANAATGGVKIIVDGKPISAEGTIINGRTLAPLRAISEAMGATVDWNAQEKRIIISKLYWETRDVKPEPDVRKIYMWIGKNKGTVSGLEFEMDVPAQIISGSTMIPVAAFGSTLSAKVEWDSKTKTVTVTSTLASTGEEAKYDALKQENDLRNTTQNYLKEVNDDFEKSYQEYQVKSAEAQAAWAKKQLPSYYNWGVDYSITQSDSGSYAASGMKVVISNYSKETTEDVVAYFVVTELGEWGNKRVIYHEEIKIPSLEKNKTCSINLEVPKQYLSKSKYLNWYDIITEL